MKSLQHLQTHVQALLEGDPPEDVWPMLELVQQRPDPRWESLPALLEAPGARWLPQVASIIDVTALKAGLLLMHDFMEESHAHAQSIEGQGAGRLGDYWHAILHRREPDASNAKYWFRQVGTQPLFVDLARRARTALTPGSAEALEWCKRLGIHNRWNPNEFVDLCESARQGDADLAQAARTIQRIEMLLLFRQNYQQATGITPVSGAVS